MSPAEQDRYRAALEPWVKRCRAREVISHVVYRDGHASVTITPRTHQPVGDEGRLL